MRVFRPEKHGKKIEEVLTQLYLLKQGLSIQKVESLKKQVDKIRDMLKVLKELLKDEKK